MNIRTKCINFDAASQLQEYIDKKVSKLERIYADIISADVVLTLVKPETANNKTAQISLAVKHNDLVAEKTANSFEEAITLATEALEKQLEKYKEKNK